MKTLLSSFLLLVWATLCHAQAFPQLDLRKNLLKIDATADDPFSYPADFAPKNISISEFGWVTLDNLPEKVNQQRSNNNVTITIFENRLFLAFRNSVTHFASKSTKIYIMSSLNGVDWDFEAEIGNFTDVREPQLFVMNNELNFVYFKGGSNPFQFKPSGMLKLTRKAQALWSEPVKFLDKGEVPWEMKTRQGATYLTSYEGTHYSITKPSHLNVMFKKTLDGEVFTPVDPSAKTPTVYHGGVSETGWEFDHEGNVWAVTRNEDGDESGFGSQIMFAPKENLSKWQKLGPIDRNCYMSPKMFRVGKDMYLIGRKQLGKKPFGRTDFSRPMPVQRINNWVNYSLSPKGTGLYKINKETHKIEFVMDLPGHGDTAFPSIYRLNEKEFVIANYTSDLNKPQRSWLFGHLMPTHVYLLKLKFE